MGLAAVVPLAGRLPLGGLWRGFTILGALSLLGLGVAIGARTLGIPGSLPAGLLITTSGLGLALLVQILGMVIGSFSARYLEGESGQAQYLAGLAAMLAVVHLLLLADHWLLVILAWSGAGVALRQLLCFYPERSFARLAAHKKRLADLFADGLLLLAAAAAWLAADSGSLSDLWDHVARQGSSAMLEVSAIALVLAVIVRSALLPVHGWLIQVMEAPTPVSALLHAGVINLGAFVVIRFAPLVESSDAARALLVLFGLASAVLAGMVVLTRVSIKVRLAWSTVAQMGFMLLECGLGLYKLAALHLAGHSLYKAHAFLSASSIVRQTRLQTMQGAFAPSSFSLGLAPFASIAIVGSVHLLAGASAWPWWWTLVLGVAWAPLLWAPARDGAGQDLASGLGAMLVAGLSMAAVLAHSLPLGIADQPHPRFGLIAVLGLAGLYLGLVLIHRSPKAMRNWRRWSYAGFYLDEAYTRLALRLWPTHWVPLTGRANPARAAATSSADSAALT